MRFGSCFLDYRLAKMLPGWIRRGCFENPEPVTHRPRMEKGWKGIPSGDGEKESGVDTK
jgi:hypothetical protein